MCDFKSRPVNRDSMRGRRSELVSEYVRSEPSAFLHVPFQRYLLQCASPLTVDERDRVWSVGVRGNAGSLNDKRRKM